MLLRNVIKRRVDSAVDGMPKLDNYYITKKPKRAKGLKLKKGTHGLSHDSGGGIASAE